MVVLIPAKEGSSHRACGLAGKSESRQANSKASTSQFPSIWVAIRRCYLGVEWVFPKSLSEVSSSLPVSWFKLTTKIKHHSKSEVGVGFELGMCYHSSWSYTTLPLSNFISFWDSTSSTGSLGYLRAFWSFCWLSLDHTHQPEASQAWTAETFQVESPFPPCLFSTIWGLLNSFLNPVCVRVSIAVRKRQDQKILWEERLCISVQLSGHGLSVNEARSGTWLEAGI